MAVSDEFVQNDHSYYPEPEPEPEPSPTPPPEKRRVRRPPRRAKQGRLGIIAIVIVILVAIVLLVPQIRTPLFQMFNPSSYREYPESVEFTVRRNIKITNVLDHEIDIPLPQDFPRETASLQKVVSVGTSPPYSPLTKYGDEWMLWKANGDADITITYTMRTKTLVWNIEPEYVMTVEEAMSSDEDFQMLDDRHNHKEWLIDPTDPQIVSLANQLDNGGTIYDQIKSIFDYLDENFEYRTENRGNVKAPTKTLADRNGDCDDLSFLFSAISRAMGIPSWIELGSLYDEYNQQWIGHAWIMLYLPMKKGESGAVNLDVVNREFLIRTANRFSDWSSDGSYSDLNGNGIAEDNETHLWDYYRMYVYTPLGNTYFSDISTGLDYKESGTVGVQLGSERSIPALDVLLIIPLFIMAYAVVYFISKKNQKR
jgi:transglutaminase-like putative cysteine protease